MSPEADDAIPNEEHIHKLYQEMQDQRKLTKEQIMRRNVMAQEPDSWLRNDRQAFYSGSSRAEKPSFRSQFFNVGDGIQTLAPGETKILAQLTVPSFHSGVLTGFSQDFINCDDETIYSIKWGVRINGLPPPFFPDFVGRFSFMTFPHSVYFPLAGGAATLGYSGAVPGSTPLGEEDIPTVYIRATNNYNRAVVLQARLEGYMFPLAERNDEFASI